ncbi:MAG: cytochrome C oxidase subunit IV [Micrococcales bacterium]|nr:MAG: cytochrome C oxidase subunit IV [Micrococcales bacterium]
MRTEALIFNGLTVFFLPVTIVYGFWTDLQEPVGFYAFLLTTLMSLMIGAYLTLIRRNIDPRPEDNPDGMISELAGEQGHFSPWSWWPLPLAAASGLVFYGLAVGWWVALIGVGVGLVSLVGWIFEYYVGEHAH